MATHYFRLLMILGFVGLLGAGTIGCSDAKVSSNVDQSRSHDEPTAPRLSDEYFLVAAGQTRMVGNVTESVGLRVFLYSKKTGEPATDSTVEFQILTEDAADAEEAGESPLATLSAYNSTTDEEGSAKVDLRLGAQPAVVKVRAKHESSNAVDFIVDIETLETGNLKLALVNTGEFIMPITDIDVRLYRNSEVRCADLMPYEERWEDELAREVAANVSQRVTFNELGTRERFLVTAVGRGEMGQKAAAGCLDEIVVGPNSTSERELLLHLIPLNLVGQYDVVSHWDFSEALADSGTVGSTIMTVLNIFDNPGQALYDGILALLRELIGGLITSGINLAMEQFGLADLLINAINNAIENNDALRRIRDAGRDLRDVVANLEVHSVLTISDMSMKYDLRGTDNWLGITLYWRWGCDANSPPDCGAINLRADADGSFGELGLLSSEWSGRVSSYNQLQIDRHPVNLRYGRLIIYLLNDVILPRVTDGNAHSMSEAFTYWVCDGLGRALNVNSNGEMCRDVPVLNRELCVDVVGFCESASSTLFGFADMLVSNLEYDMGFSVGGEATALEIDSDGLVDLFRDGKYEGFIQSADADNPTASPITATWEGERRPD